jgi:hypothetical protein
MQPGAFNFEHKNGVASTNFGRQLNICLSSNI